MDSSATSFPGEKRLAPQTSSPPVVTYLCRCSAPAAQSSSLGKNLKASGWSQVPSSATPSSSSLCSCPSSSRPPGQPPPPCRLLAQCCVSPLKTRLGIGGRGERSQERKWHLTAPAPNLGGCTGEGGAGRLLIV